MAGQCVACRRNFDCPSIYDQCVAGRCDQCGSGCYAGCSAGLCTVQCRTDADCPANRSHCKQGICSGCDSSTDCPVGDTCKGWRCLPTLSGDTCENAIPVDLSGDSALLETGLHFYTAEDTMGLSPAQGQDLFLRLKVPKPGILTVKPIVSGSPGGPSPSVEVQATVGRCTKGVSLATAGTVPPRFFVSPGEVTVAVTLHDAAGSLGLELDLAPGPPPPGATCHNVVPIAWDAQGRAMLTGPDLRTRQAVPVNDCGWDAAFTWDTAFTVQVPVPSGLTVVASGPEGVTPAVAIRAASCRSGTDVACADDASGIAGPVRLTVPTALAPGSYTLLVGERPDDHGPFEVDLHRVPWPANDHCAHATPLTIVGGQAEAEGDLTFAGLDGCGCQGSAGGATRGLYYSFSTVGLGHRSVEIRLSNHRGTSRVALQTACDVCDLTAGTLLTCAPTTGAGAAWIADLPEGRYLVHVMGDPGYFDLRVALGAPLTP